MGRNPRPTPPRAHRLDASIVVGLVCSILLAAGFGYWRLNQAEQITAEDFRFEQVRVDRQRLEQQRQDKYSEVRLQGAQAEWQQLVETARQLNRAHFGGLDSTEQAELGAKLRFFAEELIPATGLEGFVVSGEPLFRECALGLEEVLQAIRDDKLTHKEAVSGPPAGAYQTYRDNCGNLLPVLVERGLVDDDGQWTFEDAPIIADLLNRYRWAQIIQDQSKPWTQMTRYGGLLFARWRVEHTRHTHRGLRNQHLQTLARYFPNHDTRFARGVFAYEDGELEDALEHFQGLARAYPKAGWDGYVTYLRERIEAVGHPGPDDEPDL